MSAGATIQVSRDGPVTTVLFHRPEVRNAFDDRVIAEMTDAFRAIAADETVRAVVLGGAGKLFCAGADIQWMRKSAEYSEEQNLEDARRMATMYRTIDECPVPVVGRIQGAAFGGALGFVAACDMVFAAADARFGYTEVKLGILPAVISPFGLRKIGEGKARRYYLSGELFGAEEARRIGLVHEVVPPEELENAVQAWIDAQVKNSPAAVREIKRLIRELRAWEGADALDHCVRTIARVRVTPEAQEGLRAFLEKRAPRWQG